MLVSWTHLKMRYKGNYRRSIIGYLVSMLMGNTMGKAKLTYFMPLMSIRGEYPHPVGLISPDVMDVVKNTMTYADYRFKVNGVSVISGLEYKDCQYKDLTRRSLCQWIDNVKKQIETS